MKYDLRRAFRVTALAVLATGATAASAAAHHFSTYPIDANGFDASAEGWEDIRHDCELIVLPNAVCTVENDYDSDVGNPPGSLHTSFNVAANLGNVGTGTSVWSSPRFTIFPSVVGATPVAGTLQLERFFEVTGALLQAGSEPDTTVFLVDEGPSGGPNDPSDDVRTEIVGNGDFINEDASEWEKVSKPVPASLLTMGRNFRIEIETVASSSLQAATGQINTYYDNAALELPSSFRPDLEPLPATDVSGDAATFNSRIDPNESDTAYAYEYGTTASYGQQTQPLGQVADELTNPDGDLNVFTEPNAFRQTGLTPCTTYHYRVVAFNEDNLPGSGAPLATGADRTFTTSCPADATIQAVAPFTDTAAQFNATVDPNGQEATYTFEYGPASGGSLTATPTASAGASNDPVHVSAAVTGLAPNTAYRVRITATNGFGAADVTDFVTFTTTLTSGPGPQGGTGTTGATGGPGLPGPVGTPGRLNVAGAALTNTTVLNGDERSLMRINSRIVRVGTKGRRRGVVRIPIFCRKRVGRNCAGTVKLRTTGLINPTTRKPRKKNRRVTFVTSEYQLAQGKKGYAIVTLTKEKLDLIRKLRRVKVDVSLQVTDAAGNRQTVVRRNVQFVTSRTS